MDSFCKEKTALTFAFAVVFSWKWKSRIICESQSSDSVELQTNSIRRYAKIFIRAAIRHYVARPL